MSEETRPARVLGALTLALGALSTLLVIYVVHGSMPKTPVDLPREQQLQTIRWIPQGWAFFTRDPQEESIVPYVRDGESWKVAVPTGGSPRYMLGWDRSGRGVWVEIGLLVDGAPMSSYVSCEDEPAQCFARAKNPMTVKNRSPIRYLCGDVILSAQKPAPWAWARDGHPPTMPLRYLYLNVQC